MLLDQDATRQHRKEAECKEETSSRDTGAEQMFPQTGCFKLSSFSKGPTAQFWLWYKTLNKHLYVTLFHVVMTSTKIPVLIFVNCSLNSSTYSVIKQCCHIISYVDCYNTLLRENAWYKFIGVVSSNTDAHRILSSNHTPSSVTNLIESTHPGDGADVVCDGDQCCPGQVLFGHRLSLLSGHHVAKTTKLKDEPH